MGKTSLVSYYSSIYYINNSIWKYATVSKKRSSRNTKKVLKALKHKREKYNLGRLAGIGKYANSPRARAMRAAADSKAAYYQTDEGSAKLKADKKAKEEATKAANEEAARILKETKTKNTQEPTGPAVDAKQLELDRQAKIKADQELAAFQSSEEGMRQAQEEAERMRRRDAEQSHYHW